MIPRRVAPLFGPLTDLGSQSFVNDFSSTDRSELAHANYAKEDPMISYPLPPELTHERFNCLVTDIYYHLAKRGIDPALNMIIGDRDEVEGSRPSLTFRSSSQRQRRISFNRMRPSWPLENNKQGREPRLLIPLSADSPSGLQSPRPAWLLIFKMLFC